MNEELSEEVVRSCVKQYLYHKENGNWHEDKTKEAKGYERGADLIITGGRYNGERFTIECKGKSYADSARSINRECWLNALGQITTRMETERIILSGKTKGCIDRAYRYGLGLYWVSAKVALRRIPPQIAKVMNLYVFSVYEDGWVKEWTPRSFGRKYPDSAFRPPLV